MVSGPIPVVWIGIMALAAGCSEGPPEGDETTTAQEAEAEILAPRLRAADCLGGECRIQLDTVARIADADGTLPEQAYFQRDSAGRIWVTGYMRDTMLRFDLASGTTDTVGRLGDGPGEFRRIGVPIMGPGDSIHIPDRELQRITVVGPDLEVARIVRFRYGPWLPLGEGRYLLSGGTGTRETAGYPLHVVVEDDPGIEASFGTDDPRLVPGQNHLTGRVVGYGSEGTIWAAAPGRFVFERWDPLRQELTQTLAPPVPPELAGISEPRAGDPRRARPPPGISQVWEDADAVLWVLLMVPDPDWAPATGALLPYLEPDAYAEIYDWLLLALDPGSGTVVAEQRFDRRVQIHPTHTVLVEGAEYVADTLVFHLSIPKLVR